MEFFLDSAAVEEVKEAASWGILSGVTTNPTLAAREGKDFRAVIKEISGLVNGPVSAEVIGSTREEMVHEAHDLVKIADNVVIKIPVCAEGLAATKTLKEDGIDVNMTLVFTVNQVLVAARAGAAYVSPFIGRLDDIGTDGIERLSDMVMALANYDLDVKVIAASIRHPIHVIEAAKIGADIATVPFSVLKQIIGHPLTDAGIDRFLSDWESLQKRLGSGAETPLPVA